MEKPLFFAVLYVRFGLLDTVSGFPIDFSSTGTGDSNPLWQTSYILTAFGFLVTIVAAIFGCICCRNGKGFKEFRNSSGSLAIPSSEGFVNATSNSELTIFPPAGANSNQICRFDPLPEIKPQVPNLRPAAFSYSEREISSQDWFLEPVSNFPRNRLKYVQEYGRGWFGRVVEGEAQNITSKEKLTKVMVKILHEDATQTDQMYFLHEVKFYRDLKHPNILRLLGRCLETEPFLIILECFPNGDLKSFLSQNLASAQALAEQGVTLQMCSNITSGLQFMHENKFIHTDLAARNCLVGPDLSVKIGDYGNSIEIFKLDYYCAGSVALPVRWCAPETLKCTDVTIETREVTPPANIWSLAVVFWEICEFCKLPYAELSDDQVIVHVLGEKNYFLEKPNMFCLYKDELYRLMKLCWNTPLQRPTASQIYVILDNLVSSSRIIQKEGQVDSKRVSEEFEQRWQNLKPNSIPKRDNAVEFHYTPNCNIISPKLKNAKVVDSSLFDSPLGVFMSNKNSIQESPRLCLKSEKEKPNKTEENFEGRKSVEKVEEVARGADEIHNLDYKKKSDIEEVTPSDDFQSKSEESREKIDFEYDTEVKLPEILKTDENFKGAQPDVDSWLKGVEINNEEDESFVRKISEAIRDLDAALAMEKTSSSEENSGKSSHQNSPGKDLKESNETIVDFKLGSDTSSFKNFTQKTFELCSLQNTEQPQSLNFTYPFMTERKREFDEEYGQSSFFMPRIEDSKNVFSIKSDVFDESLKENDSLLCGQSRNSSDTDDEIWRKRIERGEITEKVKEKSKSIANLMILTHIDASDESDNDLDKPFDKNVNRSSFLRRSGSFAKSPYSSNNFGSENDIVYAVLEDEFKESLKKLSNDHKEHGHFDSLRMILPTSARNENVLENLFKSLKPTGEALGDLDKSTVSQALEHKTTKESEFEIEKFPSNIAVAEEEEDNQNNVASQCSKPSSNNFLGNVASEKLNDNKLIQEKNQDGSFSNNLCLEKVKHCCTNLKKDGILVEGCVKCDSRTFNTDSSNSSEKNSSHLKENLVEGEHTVVNNNQIEDPFVQEKNVESECLNKTHLESETPVCANLVSSLNDINLVLHEIDANALQKEDVEVEKVSCFAPSMNNCPSLVPNVNDSQNHLHESKKNVDTIQANTLGVKLNTSENETDGSSVIPENIRMDEPEKDLNEIAKEVSEEVTVYEPDKFVLKDSCFVPQIVITKEAEGDSVEEDEDSTLKLNFNTQTVKPFKLVLKDDENIPSVESLKKHETKNFDFPFPLNGKYMEKDGEDNNEKHLAKIKNSSVIIGACEDFTLDFFKGLKTASGEFNSKCNIREENQKNIQKIIEDMQNNEESLEVWDKHIEKAFTQHLKNTNFDDISFRNFSDIDNETSKKICQIISNENFMSLTECLVKTITSFIESEKAHTEKVEEPIHINRVTNLTGISSEEEYDNFKLRTPDDERSSDSGFRDKGSLSESVEDACEGKYNLEDIEAELEEAYVKGAFGSSEMEKEKDLNKNSKNFINFEFEESKFYEDENKNEEDFSDIDGEIEFWQNKCSDYYPEISEFNPTFSQGWYLHPPDENMLPYNTNVNEDIVNTLRNELRESLPVQTRSFDEFSDDFYDQPKIEDSKRDLNLQYISDFSVPLSPIIEEQENLLNETSEKNVKNSLLNESNSNKIKKTMVNLIETAKSIDTNTFMQYLDYMIENEGGDLEDIDEAEEENCENKGEEEVNSPLLIVSKDKTNLLEAENFEEDIKKVLGIESLSRSESLVSDGEQNNCTLLLEDLESGSTSKVVHERKPEDDILVVNVNTNVVTLLESSKPKLHVAFEEMKESKDDFLEVITDILENEELVFTPDLLSPDRERSLSEISRSSNGTRTGDALSDITLSSPDLVPDCFSTSVQEILQNDEANEIINELKNSGIVGKMDTPDRGSLMTSTENLTEANACSLPNIFLNLKEHHDDAAADLKKSLSVAVDKSELNESDCLPQEDEKPPTSEADDQYEMSTSFMGEDEDDYDDKDKENLSQFEQKEKSKEQKIDQKAQEESPGYDSYTADWESDTSGGEEEMSSSSGEFVWKGDHCAVKVDSNNAPKGNTNKERIDIGDHEDDDDGGDDDDDNESSTGSSASVTDFVPSSWNSQATPYRSALRSAESKGDQKQKKNVWFKKQKYHCIYEYPREPSDNEDGDNSPYNQFSFEKNISETPNKHFTFGVNTVELPNKHFPYGISNVIDYSSYTDWDILEGDDADLSLTDTDSDNGIGKKDLNIAKDFDFYNLNPFDYDFNSAGMLNDESEFFISSSSRPFQGGSSSQFFPGSNHLAVINDANNLKNLKLETREMIKDDIINCNDFVTPDSGVEDSANVTPLEKEVDHQPILLKVDDLNNSKETVVNILNNLKFNFNKEIVDGSGKKINLEASVDDENSKLSGSSTTPSNNSSSPLSQGKLGELRHTRDRLKLDLPLNHNAELGKAINIISQQSSLKS